MSYKQVPFGLFLFSLLTFPIESFAQDSTFTKKNNSQAPFYKWEIGIDLLLLIDKQQDLTGFIVKRNFQTDLGRKSLRLKVLPRFTLSPLVSGTQTNSNFYISVGYEWQRLYDQFGVLYGLDPYLEYGQIRLNSNTNGIISRQRNLNIGVSGFVGGRYYLGKHIAVTLETHLIYQYHHGKLTDNTLGSSLASAYVITHQFYLSPINAVYISYHF